MNKKRFNPIDSVTGFIGGWFSGSLEKSTFVDYGNDPVARTGAALSTGGSMVKDVSFWGFVAGIGLIAIGAAASITGIGAVAGVPLIAIGGGMLKGSVFAYGGGVAVEAAGNAVQTRQAGIRGEEEATEEGMSRLVGNAIEGGLLIGLGAFAKYVGPHVSRWAVPRLSGSRYGANLLRGAGYTDDAISNLRSSHIKGPFRERMYHTKQGDIQMSERTVQHLIEDVRPGKLRNGLPNTRINQVKDFFHLKSEGDVLKLIDDTIKTGTSDPSKTGGTIFSKVYPSGKQLQVAVKDGTVRTVIGKVAK